MLDEMKALVDMAVLRVLEESPSCVRGTERTVAGRIAINLHEEKGLRPELASYFVDQEYERAGDVVKRFYVGGARGKKVVPDLLIHQRALADGGENLPVMEVKPRRTVSREEREHDEVKLGLFTATRPRAYGQARGYLRLERGEDDYEITLPADINPYRFGVSVTFWRQGAALRWFSASTLMPDPYTVWDPAIPLPNDGLTDRQLADRSRLLRACALRWPAGTPLRRTRSGPSIVEIRAEHDISRHIQHGFARRAVSNLARRWP